MKLVVITLILIALATISAWSQAQPTPSQTALQVNQVIASWAQELEQSREVIKRLTDRVKELEAKYEPKKDQ